MTRWSYCKTCFSYPATSGTTPAAVIGTEVNDDDNDNDDNHKRHKAIFRRYELAKASHFNDPIKRRQTPIHQKPQPKAFRAVEADIQGMKPHEQERIQPSNREKSKRKKRLVPIPATRAYQIKDDNPKDHTAHPGPKPMSTSVSNKTSYKSPR
jgi:hypothetical protein